ncbi:LacI family DNA-binding transcriptional regulator [Dictyobacter aurantiacus]|uniref:LacI family transcriptional regulator n=1 Tax=Dictyobacter aurantiacus TaxID=1936993 RepID=A0A401ZR92_9CHLR|nr:LacI family DNA-binding transcriptional regulator [Dictyobacter aurantiacus]GCE09399.1 LacI family transcriptional regulator [Dictyobacter aurantiacus]
MSRTHQRVRLSDIATAASTSISTVSRVLNDIETVSISQEVKDRVLKAARSLGYQGKSNRLESINLFISAVEKYASQDLFHADIMAGVEAECRRHDIRLSYTLVEPGTYRTFFVLEKVRQSGSAGLIFLSAFEPHVLASAQALNPRMVLLNGDYKDLAIDDFLPDNDGGARLAMRYLLEHGHRHILCITRCGRATIDRRHRAYREVLEEAGYDYNPALVVDTRLWLDDVYERLKIFLMAPHPPFTAIFCGSDLAAIGAARALQERGLRIPQDISLIGFDDISVAAFMTPPLTTVRIERELLGRMAVRRLIERYTEPTLPSIRLELRCCLVERQSVANRSSRGNGAM